MARFTKYLIPVGAAVATIVGFQAVHAETAGTNITVTVQSAFTFTEDTPLSFGTIAVDLDGTNNATLDLNSDGSTVFGSAGGTSQLIEIVAATPGTFSIAGAAPSTSINVTLPTTATLTCGTCSGGTATFSVGTFESADLTSSAITTDGTGAATFDVGATLTATGTGTYEDGTYSGAYTVTAAY